MARTFGSKTVNNSFLWVYSTHDKYEFPIYICDSREELAEKLGINPVTITTTMFYAKKYGFKTRYHKVSMKEVKK